jgi:hypothetical protein
MVCDMKRDAWKYAGDYASSFQGTNEAQATVAENLRLFGKMRREQGWFDHALLPAVEETQLPPKLDRKSESRWVKAWTCCISAPLSQDTLYNRTCAARKRAGFRR